MLRQLQVRRRDLATVVLTDGPLVVGWIRDGIIGFGGFSDRADAMAAGTLAADVVTRWAGRRRGPGLAPFTTLVSEADAIRLANGIVIGRILPPDQVEADLGGHGYEIAVPEGTWLAVMLEIAQLVHAAWRGSTRVNRDAAVVVREVGTADRTLAVAP
jgi:hypothetical protein